jgi:hypothetical protein
VLAGPWNDHAPVESGVTKVGEIGLMVSFAEECRRALDMEWQTEARSTLPSDGVRSVEEMAEWHCWHAALDLQLIMRCSGPSALERTTADCMIDDLHYEPIDGPTHVEPPEPLICSYHEAVALLRTYMGTANNARPPADRSDLASDDFETPMYNSSVVRGALKLTILLETAAGLAFFGWVLNGG